MQIIEKNTAEQVRIVWTEYKGEKYIDVRTWVKTYDGRGYVRTKKGITVSPDTARAVFEALGKVVSEAN